MQAAIVAGGLGTRLGSLTAQIPKSMVDVHGRPFLAWQLDLLRRNGVTDVLLCVGHLAHVIREAIGDDGRFGLRVRYSDEADRRLGTAGSLKWAEPLVADVFFVLFGDSYVLLDYRAVMEHFLACDRLGLMVVYQNDNRWGASDVTIADGFVTAYASPPAAGMAHINMGLSVLRREAPAPLESGRPASLQDLYAPLIARRQLLAWETPQRFYEIGSPTGLEELRQLVAPTVVPR
jgi:N-acetyl-alpha-D-muramate 1-phosphate uridylyltransferase